MDHGFGAVRVDFVVAGEAAAEHEPAWGAFDHPAGQDGESPGGEVAANGFDVDAEGGARSMAVLRWPLST